MVENYKNHFTLVFTAICWYRTENILNYCNYGACAFGCRYPHLPIGGNAAHYCLLICAMCVSHVALTLSSAQLIRIDWYVSVKLVRCS